MMKLRVSTCGILFLCIQCVIGGGYFLDDFEQNNLSEWMEIADTIMPEGKSKSTFDMYTTGSSKRAVLFTILDPQEGGAAFAGIKKKVFLNLNDSQSIELNLRGRGQFQGYEFCMRHRGVSGVAVPAFCHYFTAPSEFATVDLPLKRFKPYLEGRVVPDYGTLDLTNITQVNLIAYGGANLTKNAQQKGVGALEIKWIYIHTNNNNTS